MKSAALTLIITYLLGSNTSIESLKLNILLIHCSVWPRPQGSGLGLKHLASFNMSGCDACYLLRVNQPQWPAAVASQPFERQVEASYMMRLPNLNVLLWHGHTKWFTTRRLITSVFHRTADLSHDPEHSNLESDEKATHSTLFIWTKTTRNFLVKKFISILLVQNSHSEPVHVIPNIAWIRS